MKEIINKKVIKIVLIIFLILFLVAFCIYLFNLIVENNQASRLIEIKNTNNNSDIVSKESKLFLNKIIECPNDTSTSDMFSCIKNITDVAVNDSEILSKKLISQASIRLEQIKNKNIGPASFEYGGEDFLTMLPIQIKKAEEVKDQYINSVCNLASMNIFGGSGMDLEQNACKYYFINEYIQILKTLENGLSVIK